ncbi:DUF2686 family protein, partial [Escherichia coli]|nr:DUF2686 family protein [Escherichia coli]
SIICSPMTSLKTSIKTITYLSDIGCLEIQGASLGNDPIIGIEAYPGTAEIHAKMGYKVIPGDENAPLKRMTLQPSSLPELFELKNGEWNYIGK